ncbi:hypothetical protein [Bradyrhizobium sp. dw_78]|uniref:hypothetical protein n=1 Tax=Bradyrhizobium sp. dw_78 TaxID=2719793 RepID=UPI001BD49408|nr:hypothetical protein [Bradyrhizobium sp. dw_78]
MDELHLPPGLFFAMKKLDDATWRRRLKALADTLSSSRALSAGWNMRARRAATSCNRSDVKE